MSMAERIITVALNPAIDRNMYFDRFKTGTLNRTVRKTLLSVGSKAMNVACVVRAFGGNSACLFFSGGSGGEFLEWKMREAGVTSVKVSTSCGVRENIKIFDSEGVQTEANDSGGPYTEQEFREIETHLRLLADPRTVFVFSGSLPAGCSSDYYSILIEIVKSAGAYAVLDCDGEALKCGLRAEPDLIKPNIRELEELLSVRLESIEDAQRAVREAAEAFRTDVIGTLGERGSVFSSKNGEAYTVRCLEQVNPAGLAGAGDTYLGVYCTERYLKDSTPEVSLKYAASAAAAKIQVPGTGIPDASELRRYYDRIEVRHV